MHCGTFLALVSEKVAVLQVLPFCVAVTFFVIVIFIIQTGNKNKSWNDEVPEVELLLISAAFGIAAGAVTMYVVMPLLQKRILDWEAFHDRRYGLCLHVFDKDLHSASVKARKIFG